MDDNVEFLPIDIHAGKLVEWLVSRQHASRDWAETARVVREKINAAIQDMPEHPEVTKLLSGTYINYFHCLKIVEILRETEADSKNILGWYTSQRMKDWQAIIKLYEKGGACLAESGQLLHSYVAFEIPGIKAQQLRCVQQLQELQKKKQDAGKSASHANTAYMKQCKQIGIVGDDVRPELLGLLAELPSDLAGVGQQCGDMKEAVQFYLDFVAFTCQGKFQDSLPMLRYIIEHGNVTTYEYLHGEPPLSVEDPTDAILQGAGGKAGGGATAGDGDTIGGGGGGDAIDFGDEGAAGEIDFGDDGGIDFGDETIDWTAADVRTADITVEESGVQGGVARNTEALTILHNKTMRDKILDDIYELEGFLRQRIAEVSSPQDSIVAMSQWDEAPKTLQMVSSDHMTSHLKVVQDVLFSLGTPKMQQLLLISASHRYVDRLTESLREQKKRSIVCPLLLIELIDKQKKVWDQQLELDRQLKQIKMATKALCGQIQQAVSDKYNNRPVNIMGVMQSL